MWGTDMGSRNPKEEREDRRDAREQEARERAEAEAKKKPPVEGLPAPDPSNLLDLGVAVHLLVLRAQTRADAGGRAEDLRRAGEYVERMRERVEELKAKLGA
jgi:hypothetical protein